jgi:putative endonuclease
LKDELSLSPRYSWRADAKEGDMDARTRLPAVYILCNRPFGTLYVGVTSDLPARIWQHRIDAVPGFTSIHRLHRLVWYEVHETMYSAISREKQLKKWNRAWKIRLIIQRNPGWRDMWDHIRR